MQSKDINQIIPKELIQMTFMVLSIKDLCAVSLVNKLWHQLHQEDYLWQQLSI